METSKFDYLYAAITSLLFLGLCVILLITSAYAADFSLNSDAVIPSEQGEPYYQQFCVFRDRDDISNSLLTVQYFLEKGGNISSKSFDADSTWGGLTAQERGQLANIVKKIVCADVSSRFSKTCN